MEGSAPGRGLTCSLNRKVLEWAIMIALGHVSQVWCLRGTKHAHLFLFFLPVRLSSHFTDANEAPEGGISPNPRISKYCKGGTHPAPWGCELKGALSEIS